MYFSKFPVTLYSLDDKASVQTVRNILLRNKINDDVKNNFAIYDEYDVLDGETPEIVAHKFYGNAQLHWLVLHMNDILDPRFDWPMNTLNLYNYSVAKYANVNAAHHFINANGDIVNSTAAGATPVSNYQYEQSINESKRRIKVLKQPYVDIVMREFFNTFERVNGQ